MEKITFIDMSETQSVSEHAQEPSVLDKKDIDKFDSLLRKKLDGFFPEASKIALKLHMGEEGNKYYLKPEYAKKIVTVLKSLNLKPFLFDSPVIYAGFRNSVEKYYKTAERHGFTEKTIGCPIIISNESVNVKTEHLDVEVCKPLHESEYMLVLSHVKGHGCAGFGAAIKNLGMGGAAKKTKKDIHDGGAPIINDNCTACGDCAKACAMGAITIKNKAVCDYGLCFGCSVCYYVCPNNAIKPKNATFDLLLAESACASIKHMKKVFYVNVLMDISKFCDCWSGENSIVFEDIGILFGNDIVAIDKASFDLIHSKAGKDLFKEIHHKSPLLQIEAASKLGIGKIDYGLEKY